MWGRNYSAVSEEPGFEDIPEISIKINPARVHSTTLCAKDDDKNLLLQLSSSDQSLKEYAKKYQHKRTASRFQEINEIYDDDNYLDYGFLTDDNNNNNNNQYNEEFLTDNADPDGIIINKEDCTQFMNTVNFAKELVQFIISESEFQVPNLILTNSKNHDDDDDDDDDITENNYDTEAAVLLEDNEEENDADNNFKMQNFRESSEFSYVETKKLVSWPTIENFTIEIAALSIDEYLSSFDTDEDWMYVIYYRGETRHTTKASTIHKYQAIYSLPTWKYPIAQATASLFFYIEVCSGKPGHCTVEVTYHYETFRHLYHPQEFDFQEKWLHYILDSKIKLFQTITY